MKACIVRLNNSVQLKGLYQFEVEIGDETSLLIHIAKAPEVCVFALRPNRTLVTKELPLQEWFVACDSSTKYVSCYRV